MKRRASSSIEGEPKQKKPRDAHGEIPSISLARGQSPPRLKLELSLSFSESQGGLEFSDESLRKSGEAFAKFSQESGFSKEIPKLLDIRFYTESKIGKRPTNEDAEFFCSIEGIGALAGVFDGHGDRGKISGAAAKVFQQKFPELIRQDRSNAEQIMKNLCEKIHKAVTVPVGGTTALICFFDTEKKRLTVGTLGDSRAMLFRKVGDRIEFEWLSEEMNWATPAEEARAKEAFQNDKIFAEWIKLEEKKRYFPSILFEDKRLIPRGVNVSHSIGDKSCTYEGREAISHVPKTKTIDLEKDVLVLSGCDGLWDFVTIQNLIKDVILPHWEHKHTPEKIVEYALKTSTDNVSVICAWAKEMGAPAFHNTQLSVETQSLEKKD